MSEESTVNGKDYMPEILAHQEILNRVDKLEGEGKNLIRDSCDTLGLMRDVRFPSHDVDHWSPIYRILARDYEIEKMRRSYCQMMLTKWKNELCPNVLVALDDIAPEKDDERNPLALPSTLALFDLFKEKYIDRAAVLSVKETIEKAQNLVKRDFVRSERVLPKPEDIVAGNVLKLHFFFSGTPEYNDEFKALVKLIKMALDEVSPVTADSDVSTLKHHVEFKVYKNHRFDVKFESHEDALHIAKVLIVGAIQKQRIVIVEQTDKEVLE